jgi:hypothetical protein
MTHAYSTDSGERRSIPLYIALAAIAAAFGVVRTLRAYGLEAPWWISPPDTMMFYGLFYLFFDKVVWRWGWIRSIGITKIPDLSGTWKGQVVPSATMVGVVGTSTPTDITFSIRQSWTEMSIVGRTTQSSSHSLSGHMMVSDECSLSYDYLNEPSASAVATMHGHHGRADLLLENDGRSLRGEYFSGRDRQSFGTIQLARLSKAAVAVTPKSV